MKQCLFRLASALVCIAMAGSLAYAQGAGDSAALSGTVLDTSGAHVPGANVVVKNQATGSTYQSVTNAQGTFTIPALQPGLYSVTVSLTGFKQVVIKDNKLLAATPLSVKATLAPGGIEETITVEGGGTPLVQTQSASVAHTIEVNMINNLPVQSRNALDFLTYATGVSTPGGNRDSTIIGLDQGAINITVDGLSVQDNFNKTNDGYFARLSPRLDAVEEVTLTTAAAGADTSGQGGAQIRFITRQGTNQYHGSVYEYLRREKLNANSWFNNRDLPPDPVTGKAPRAQLKFDNYGFRLGGPIRIPGLFNGENRAFFFVNYEELRQPSSITRSNRFILSPLAEQGIFPYTAGGAVRQVNLLQLAAANGQTSTMDPTVAKLLADIRNSTSKGGLAALTDPLVQRLTFQHPTSNVTKYPTVRLDFQLSQKHRFTVTGQFNDLLSNPDTTNNREPPFPGFPHTGSQDSQRWAFGGSLRSTLNQNLVNDLRLFGATGGRTLFSNEFNPEMWKGTIANTLGYQFNLNGACCGTGQALTNAASTVNTSSREASTRIANDTLTWIRGAHNFSFGVEFVQQRVWLKNQQQVPQINFGLATGDPALSMFNTTNFPGASTAQLNNARALYAILTGRINSITGEARLDEATNKYVFLGESMQRASQNTIDLFFHDTWRAKPNLTLNYGLRYNLALPWTPLNDSLTTPTIEDMWGVSGVGNYFKAGTLTGNTPAFHQLKKGTKAYNTDWNNFAPSLGAAWRPTFDSGVLRAVFGGEPVFRTGFSMAYSRNGSVDFTGVYGNNPGIFIPVNRDQTTGTLGAVPLLIRDQGRLGAAPFNETPTYPLPASLTGSIRMFDPDIKIPYSASWQAGIQRQLGKTFAIEARYVGSRGLQLWTGTLDSGLNLSYNLNEPNIVQSGFLNEFRLAQQNLQANIRAGRGSSFAYFGPGTGTSPLPIYLGFFNGVPRSASGDPSRYTGGNWSNSNFTDPLAIFNPQPYTPAGTSATTGLQGDPTRRANAIAAGLPVNFFRANPDVTTALLRGNGGGTRYHGFDLELRKRYSHGLQFTSSYSFGKTYEWDRYGFDSGWQKRLNGGAVGGITHAFKLYGIWELPVGKGKRFAGNAGGLLDRIIGGWSVAGDTRIQSGRQLDWGNVRVVGMSQKEFQHAYKLRFDDAGRKIYNLPQDIIDNTVKAFSVSATSPTGYGAQGPPSGRYLAPANGPDCIELFDVAQVTAAINANQGSGMCGTGTLVTQGPMFWTSDLSLVKKIKLKGQVTFDFRAELLNAFNHANFTPVATPSNNVTSYEITGADGPRVAQLVGRISW